MNITQFVPGRIRRKLLSLSYRIHPREDLLRLGSPYGGWIIPFHVIDESSVCYCAGVGEDVTFDLELIRRFGCIVHAFDPTPEAERHVASITNLSEKFVFHRYGLWSLDDTLRFYAPRNPKADISHSALNLQGTNTYFEGPVKSLLSIMTELGHSSIDLLKMDIEGAEHTVLQHMQDQDVWPNVLCVEFDQPCSLPKIHRQIKMLERQGYTIAATDRWNFTFVRCHQSRIAN